MEKRRSDVNKKIKMKSKSTFMRIMVFIFMIIFVAGGNLNRTVLCQAKTEEKNDSKGNRVLQAVVDKENKYVFAGPVLENDDNSNAEDSKRSDENSGQDNEDNMKTEDDNKLVGTSKEGRKFTYDAKEIFQKLKKGDYSNGGKKMVFLTFDDGTSNTVTPKILETLKTYDVKATFFILGKIVEDGGEKARALVKQEFEEGHAIGNHSYSHEYSILYPGRSLNLQQFNDDFNKNEKLLKSILGEDFSTRLIRCPGGYMSWKNMGELDNYLEENNMVTIDWNALSGDAEGGPKNAQQLVDYAVKTSADYDIVVLLMHDTYGKEESAKALPGIIEHFKSKGYEFKTLS